MSINIFSEIEHLNSLICNLVNATLKEFGLNINEHIVAATTEWVSAMVKFGQEITPGYHQWLAHIIYFDIDNKNAIDEKRKM